MCSEQSIKKVFEENGGPVLPEECLVSMIVPVYQTPPDVLEGCIRSLLRQKDIDSEVLAVLDGRQEEALRVLKSLEAEAAGSACILRTIEIAHQGVSAARNTGIRAARGRWILFVDSDDRLEEAAASLLVSAAEQETEMVIGDYSVCSSGGSSRRPRRYLGNEHVLDRGSSDERRIHFLREVLNPQTGLGFCWAKLFLRKRLLEEELFFKEDLAVGEDVELVFRYCVGASSIKYLPALVYRYQTGPDSVVHRFHPEYEARYFHAMETLEQTVLGEACGRKLHEAFETCVLYHFLLITVNDSFHPERRKSQSVGMMIKAYKALTQKPVYKTALQEGNAASFFMTRRIIVWLIRHHLWHLVYLTACVRHISR